MMGKALPIPDADSDALPAVKTARTLSQLWPLIGGVAFALVSWGAMRANLSFNASSIEQLKSERAAEYRLLDERMRRIEEGQAGLNATMQAILERVKGR